jgi:hypothetical protein
VPGRLNFTEAAAKFKIATRNLEAMSITNDTGLRIGANGEFHNNFLHI